MNNMQRYELVEERSLRVQKEGANILRMIGGVGEMRGNDEVKRLT